MKNWLLSKDWAKILTPINLLVGIVLTIIITFICHWQATIGEQQTKLLAIQTKIANTQISPRFSFEYVLGEGPCHFLVTNNGQETRKLRGRCVPFVEVDLPDVGEKRIRLSGIYADGEIESLSSGNLYFYHHDMNGRPMYTWILDPLIRYRPKYAVKHFIELRYYNLLDEEEVKRYIVGHFEQDTEPVDQMPSFDAHVDLRQYFDKEEIQKGDYDEAGRDILEAIGALSAISKTR